MERMLVTQALNELKTLDARITRAIDNAVFVTHAKTCEKKVDPSKTKEEFSLEAMASMQSINDLIDRRENIKSAIIESNAKTIVSVCGEKYSVAKVIDMKSSIKYRKDLLCKMKSQLAHSNVTVSARNSNVETSIDQLVATAFGRDSKSSIKEEDYASIANPYRINNEWSIVDPINVESRIKDLEEYIEDFESSVDSVLQVSNCITYIEF